MTAPLIQINGKKIGEGKPTYIIAEIGINHNGDPALAAKLIDVAAKAGADSVKFQKRNLASLYPEDMLIHPQKYEQHFQYMIPLLQSVELEEDAVVRLRQQALSLGMDFLCTPFDIPSADFLEQLDIHAFKIASADLNNRELLSHVAKQKRPMIISTGMSFREEIRQAIDMLKKDGAEFALLHCRSTYPVWPREVNLKMINWLKQFDVPVGYSGHDIGIVIPLVAASMGASIIEKHITLDKTMEGPDHKISLEPFELERMVRDIRIADMAMAKGNRFLLRGEVVNREVFGKSLVAACRIPEGTRITRKMIDVKGPGKGLPPSNMDELIGRVITRDLEPEEFFLDEDLTRSGSQIPDASLMFKSKWGLIARFGDFEEMIAHGPKVIEIHLAEKDLEQEFDPRGQYEQELVVHAAEYMDGRLMDLCSFDEEIRAKSVELVNRTCAMASRIGPQFKGTPKIVAHPGAMSLNVKLPKDKLKEQLIRSLTDINTRGTELLLENLPPYPWYFGGAWKGNYFMAADEIECFCGETGMNIVFDISHAALYCNAKAVDLYDYIKTVYPYIRHIHMGDGYGVDGEGVQINEGDIDFNRVMPLFSEYEESWVPETWQGHLSGGKGFFTAIRRLAKYDF